MMFLDPQQIMDPLTHIYTKIYQVLGIAKCGEENLLGAAFRSERYHFFWPIWIWPSW